MFPDGLLAFAHYLSTPSRREVAPPIEVRGQLETGEVRAVLHFFARKPTTFALYANDRPVPAGGTGLDGLLSGTARVLSRIGRREGLINDDEDDFCRHDVVYGLTAILNVHLGTIEYGGPYGGPEVRWVANPELGPKVLGLTERRLGAYFAEQPEHARRIVQHYLRLRRLTDAQWARRHRNSKMLEAMN